MNTVWDLPGLKPASVPAGKPPLCPRCGASLAIVPHSDQWRGFGQRLRGPSTRETHPKRQQAPPRRPARRRENRASDFRRKGFLMHRGGPPRIDLAGEVSGRLVALEGMYGLGKNRSRTFWL